MHPTKAELINANGLRCMLCGKEFPYRQLSWHHIKWKSICKKNKEPIDNSYENGLIVCVSDHAYLHTLDYDSEEYHKLMEFGISQRKPKIE